MVAFLATACSAVELPSASELPSILGGDGQTNADAPPADGTTDAPAAEPTDGDPTGGDPDAPASADATEPVAEPTNVGRQTPLDDNGSLGSAGPAILRQDRPRLVVEVDTQDGVEVSSGALDHLLATIRQLRPDTEVGLAGGNAFSSDDESWTTDELRAAAASHRTTASDGGTVSLHLLAVRGALERDGEETNAIGVAYGATTMAIFPDRLDGLGAIVGSNTAVERAVLVHELGHLLGLVNLTYTSPIDHEDPEHPGHSSNEGSVMFHAVETTLVSQVFRGPPPDTFDEDDLADLAGLRDGSLGR